MKKVIALALTLAMGASLVACGGSNSGTTTPDVTETTYKTGVGTVISAKVADETEEKGANAQINTTIVVATFDNEGKVVSATIDVAQQKAAFDLEGKADGEVKLVTKNEQGADYNMVKFGNAIAEIDAQHASLAEWFVGKTVEEIKGMKTYARDDAHPTVPDEEDLKASVTITVQDYIAAIEKAYANAKETTGVVAKTGLGTDISAKITEATADKGASAQINTTIVGVALDAEGKIASVTIDVAQQTAKFDLEGKVDGEVDLRTKIEKGADYGMLGSSAIGKEYDAQIAALEAWMIGKTVEEVKAMAMDDKTVPTEEDLTASVTIKVGSYLTALDKAAVNAK